MKYCEYPASYAWNERVGGRASDATARLLAEIGENVVMKSGLTGSGATLENASSSFKEDCEYADVAIIAHRDDKVFDELEKGRLVFMAGFD